MHLLPDESQAMADSAALHPGAKNASYRQQINLFHTSISKYGSSVSYKIIIRKLEQKPLCKSNSPSTMDLNDRLNCLRILNLHFYKYLKFSRFSHLFNLSPFKRPVCLILTCSAFRAVQSAALLIIGEIVKVNIFERLSLEWIFRFLQLDLHL